MTIISMEGGTGSLKASGSRDPDPNRTKIEYGLSSSCTVYMAWVDHVSFIAHVLFPEQKRVIYVPTYVTQFASRSIEAFIHVKIRLQNHKSALKSIFEVYSRKPCSFMKCQNAEEMHALVYVYVVVLKIGK